MGWRDGLGETRLGSISSYCSYACARVQRASLKNWVIKLVLGVRVISYERIPWTMAIGGSLAMKPWNPSSIFQL